LSINHQIAPGQELFAADLQALSRTFAQSGETIYKARNEVKRLQWQGVPVIAKAFGVPGALRGFIYGQLRRSKACKSFSNALELIRRGSLTPQPIGFIEHRQAFALKQSFYVCHEWPARFTLREPLFDPAFANRVEILQALGRFAWDLHRKQIHHRDFSAGNILIREKAQKSSTGDHWEFCLVDVNRMRFESLSFKERMGNFAMLWASNEDLEIIVKAYAQASGDDPQDALALALKFSSLHKHRANRKERIKTLLGLH
jgi:serine/threonine protein kinase